MIVHQLNANVSPLVTTELTRDATYLRSDLNPLKLSELLDILFLCWRMLHAVAGDLPDWMLNKRLLLQLQNSHKILS